MKVTRLKHFKRTLLFYTTHFPITEPLRVYLHHSTVQYCIDNQVDLGHLVAASLPVKVKLTTLKCCKHLDISKQVKKEMRQYLAMPCDLQTHDNACYEKHDSAICVQDPEARKILRNRVCVPLMYFNGTSLVVEPVSPMSKRVASQCEKHEALSAHEKGLLDKVESTEVNHPVPHDVNRSGKMPPRRKRKGPNPLSCKKKQKPKDSRRSRKNKIVI